MGQKIVPHLWFDTQAVEAMNFYLNVFPQSEKLGQAKLAKTPSGEVDMVSFKVFDLEIAAISAGPYQSTNPSISFFIECSEERMLSQLWRALEEEGTALMPLNDYAFSPLFGWVQDKFGVSWQLSLNSSLKEPQILTMLLFTKENAGRAEEAMKEFVRVFPDSEIKQLTYYPQGMDPEVEGQVMQGAATLTGQSFLFVDSSQPHAFAFSPGVSLMVYCEDQEEIDDYWEKLSYVPEAEQCGWVCDSFGISWQIVPTDLNEKMFHYDWETLQRVNQVIQTMKKLNIAQIKQAEKDKPE